GYALTNGELRPFVRTAEGWLLRPDEHRGEQAEEWGEAGHGAGVRPF
ncbi:MAG: hypothetical protein RLZZ322_1599, partial [Verrucomicrobiota bacterium]